MRYQGIKVSLVTGFLGAGKTTLIRSLLAQVPAYERWAVLVNEFGDIGLDGALLSDTGVAIKEVPGGCVCCVTSTAFTQGINQLIREQNPDRILIEPSGLGHPKQIIASLNAPQYQDVLWLTGAFCVLDARNLADTRYTQHAIFNDQLECADVLVASHVTDYCEADTRRLMEYCQARGLLAEQLVMNTTMKLLEEDLDPRLQIREIDAGKIVASQPADLHKYQPSHDHDHSHIEQYDKPSRQANKKRHYVKQQGGMKVVGWQWPADCIFAESRLRSGLAALIRDKGIYRIKGVFLLGPNKALFVNGSRGILSMKMSPWDQSNRFEVIGLDEEVWESNVCSFVDKVR
ncbi:CobW family GTP-binding protein [Marinomonas pollencensis]|uniref:G3E family GTPase n=1 Tax=Marinomonas pollencensis TaxID=491954 RepID=A0A3E0DWY0_9GAMM|nr:GTP-binding protein [Marinomonas pollencensis]REG86591.1 G3E family GTPase [Marinomonas pollencensis]